MSSAELFLEWCKHTSIDADIGNPLLVQWNLLENDRANYERSYVRLHIEDVYKKRILTEFEEKRQYREEVYDVVFMEYYTYHMRAKVHDRMIQMTLIDLRKGLRETVDNFIFRRLDKYKHIDPNELMLLNFSEIRIRKYFELKRAYFIPSESPYANVHPRRTDIPAAQAEAEDANEVVYDVEVKEHYERLYEVLGLEGHSLIDLEEDE